MVESHISASAHTPRVSNETYGETVRTRLAGPVDKVRWGPVLAGLFATLSTLAVLSVLGLAIGLSTVDRYSDASNFGIGAGIWGAVSALLAFAVGGYIAACTAVVGGRNNGVLQGAVVWMVTIALLIYLLAGGVGAMFRTATSTAIQTGAQTAGAVADTAARTATNDPNSARGSLENAQTTADQAATEVSRSAQNAVQSVRENVNARDVEEAAERSAAGAWGLLISMLLGLAAACVGGFVGARRDYHDDERRISDLGHSPTRVG
jgi:hypothetical protein